MIGLSPEEWDDLKKGSSKGSASKPSQSNSVIDEALKLEGVTGRAADFIKSIYHQESGSGSNTKTSNRGAVGGMQVIPTTFKLVANPDWDINKPLDNARAGVRYAMRQWNASRGDPAIAAAGYYGGDGGRIKATKGIAVRDPKNEKAPDTLQYGQQVAARMGSSNAPSGPTAAPTAASQPSAGVSGARGLAQGATAGWSDELAGAGAAAGGALNRSGISPAVVAASPVIGTTLAALMVLAGSKTKDESLADTYTRIRDSERRANADARDANPGAYTTTQVLGTLLPAALIKSPTALGAVNGAGNSDANTIGGVVKDTATGAAFGKVAGVAGNLAGAGLKKVGDKFGNEAVDRVISATGPAPSLVRNTLTGAGAGATTGAGVALQMGQLDKLPEFAWNGAIGGAALGATGSMKSGATNKVASEIYKRTGDANMGSSLVNSGAGKAVATAGSAAAANLGASSPAKEGTDNVLDWVKNVMGLDTPAGQQNLPESFRTKMADDAAAVREGLKDGRPAPDVPNIIKEDGNEYLVTPSGRRVKLN